ncbi:MAG TPA: hypothetical protein VF648_01185 [Pyrinomonadaceae bacterium]|jgi:hypothetical protein
MKELRKKQLDEILNQYENRETEVKQYKDQRQIEAENFVADFKRLRQEVIRPVFENIGNQLKARGHDYEIREQDETTDAQGRRQPPQILMSIYPSGVERSAYRADSTPKITFYPETSIRSVHLHLSTMQPGKGGSAGNREKFPINEIDTDTIEKHVIKAVGDIFKPAFR